MVTLLKITETHFSDFLYKIRKDPSQITKVIFNVHAGIIRKDYLEVFKAVKCSQYRKKIHDLYSGTFLI